MYWGIGGRSHPLQDHGTGVAQGAQSIVSYPGLWSASEMRGGKDCRQRRVDVGDWSRESRDN